MSYGMITRYIRKVSTTLHLTPVSHIAFAIFYHNPIHQSFTILFARRNLRKASWRSDGFKFNHTNTHCSKICFLAIKTFSSISRNMCLVRCYTKPRLQALFPQSLQFSIYKRRLTFHFSSFSDCSTKYSLMGIIGISFCIFQTVVI